MGRLARSARPTAYIAKEKVDQISMDISHNIRRDRSAEGGSHRRKHEEESSITQLKTRRGSKFH